jgi:hypothetical protein
MNTATSYTPSPETLAALRAGDMDALIAASRARFGGFLYMEDGAGDGAGDGDGGDSGANEDGAGNDSAADDGATDDGENSDDPRVKRANAQAAKARVEKNELAKQLADAQAASQAQLDAIAKALGLKGEDEAPDSAKLASQVETLTGENSNLRAALLVHELAGAQNANPVALLDSNKFSATLAKLDASADDYRAQVTEAIKAAVTENAAYKLDQGSSRGGGEIDPSKREANKGERAKGIGAAIGAAYSK